MDLRVKEICKEKGFSIGQLADKMEIHRESLSRAINGNPTIETLDKIANALEVHISDLFERPDDNCFRCPKCGTTLEIKEK